MTQAIHVVAMADHTDHHRATALCPCKPRQMRDLLEPARIVWRHRGPNGSAESNNGGAKPT